jgi:hypothetical protein
MAGGFDSASAVVGLRSVDLRAVDWENVHVETALFYHGAGETLILVLHGLGRASFYHDPLLLGLAVSLNYDGGVCGLSLCFPGGEQLKHCCDGLDADSTRKVNFGCETSHPVVF